MSNAALATPAFKNRVPNGAFALDTINYGVLQAADGWFVITQIGGIFPAF